MAEKSMVGEDSIGAAERFVEEQHRGDTDHARAHGKRDRDDRDADKSRKMDRR